MNERAGVVAQGRSACLALGSVSSTSSKQINKGETKVEVWEGLKHIKLLAYIMFRG